MEWKKRHRKIYRLYKYYKSLALVYMSKQGNEDAVKYNKMSEEEKVNLIHEATINIQLNLINSAIKSSIDKGLIPGGENK